MDSSIYDVRFKCLQSIKGVSPEAQQKTVQFRWKVPLPLKIQTLWKLNLEEEDHLWRICVFWAPYLGWRGLLFARIECAEANQCTSEWNNW